MNFECPSCSQLIMNVPDDLAGKRGKCPHCQKVIKIPLEGIVMKAPPAPPRPPSPPASAPRPPAPTQPQFDLQFPEEDSFLNVDVAEEFDAEEDAAPLPTNRKRRKKGKPEPLHPESGRYQMLKLYLSCIRMLAYIGLAGAIIFFVAMVVLSIINSDEYFSAGLFISLLTGGSQLLIAAVSAMVILGGVEFVQLFIDIERQLRKNGDFLESIEVHVRR